MNRARRAGVCAVVRARRAGLDVSEPWAISGESVLPRSARRRLIFKAAPALRAVALLCFTACSSEHVRLVRDPVVDTGGRSRDGGPRLDASPNDPMRIDATVGDAASGIYDAATRPPDASTPARCGKGPCACDDGIDNDHDGLTDGLDPECTGVLDEDEASFATGKPPKAKNCRDCFWDEDQGTGSDVCRYPTACLRGSEPTGNGNCSSCEVSDACVSMCAARTPNGCDCFGCCEVERPNGVTITIEFSDRCSLRDIDNPVACPRCTQSTQCRNECGRCQICPGRTLADLPADCRARTPAVQCDPGQPVCDTSLDCTTDQYCQQGCCFTSLL
jgi:hypothetical protein